MSPDDPRRANLVILADFLDRAVPPPKFEMYMYISRESVEGQVLDHSYIYAIAEAKDWPIAATQELYSHCNTAACAAGHGPLAGIEPLEYETWNAYVRRCFVDTHYGSGVSREFNWLFASDWTFFDNTPRGAAARIRYFLEHGVPDDADHQRRGIVPLCYTVDPTA